MKIEHCDGAIDSRDQALSHFPDKKQATTAFAAMTARLNFLMAGRQLRNPDQMRKEGKLPNDKFFYAIKTPKRLRAYGWHSSLHKGTFFVSHYAFKKGEKLDQSDTTKVISNWWIYEKENRR
ncbi:hypothetical protein HGG82_07130 [Marinomonas sp. M1K-6]|uniref:Uncharacterized protein n=1 Tax=Marinomonas profundi TaxID=2726122 RepID=A0A847QW13_9GAMM|nr:hypothetical protein [Marinomonas profundi]NLQ17398.1 hypothetical protein [Marinomonas profundi]UDV01924.1 hypothetical protein J8N69_09910 [Marinomonas profundi]